MTTHNPTATTTGISKNTTVGTLPRFKTLRSEFFSGVQLVQSAVSTRATLPILSNILIEADPDGLTLAATDLEVGIKTRVKADVEIPGSVTAPAKLLSDFLRTLDDKKEVSVTVGEGPRLDIRSGRDRCALTGLAKDDYPVLPALDLTGATKVDRAALRDMVRRTVFAASSDETRYVLNGVHFSLADGVLNLVATDGRRLALARLKGVESKAPVSAIVPTKALQELLRVLGSEDPARKGQAVEMGFSENQVSFRDGETVVLSRLVEGHFPSYEQVIPKGHPTRLRLERAGFQAAVARASIGALERGGSVQLQLSGGTMRISASSQGRVEVEAEIAVPYEGSPLAIAFNPAYILDVLKVSDDPEIVLELGTALNPGAIRPVEGDHFVYVLMPMKV